MCTGGALAVAVGVWWWGAPVCVHSSVSLAMPRPPPQFPRSEVPRALPPGPAVSSLCGAIGPISPRSSFQRGYFWPKDCPPTDWVTMFLEKADGSHSTVLSAAWGPGEHRASWAGAAGGQAECE